MKTTLSKFTEVADAHLYEDDQNEYVVIRIQDHHYEEQHIYYSLDDLRKHERWIDSDADLSLMFLSPTVHRIRTKTVK